MSCNISLSFEVDQVTEDEANALLTELTKEWSWENLNEQNPVGRPFFKQEGATTGVFCIYVEGGGSYDESENAIPILEAAARAIGAKRLLELEASVLTVWLEAAPTDRYYAFQLFGDDYVSYADRDRDRDQGNEDMSGDVEADSA